MKLQPQFTEIVSLIKQARYRAFKAVNTELIDLYWQIGQYIAQRTEQEGWGKGTVQQLADYIGRTEPDLKGFSDKNLWRMKQFYETYRGNEKLSALLRELSWTHNLIIFSRCQSQEERAYYLHRCLAEKWSKRELERQIQVADFERTMLSNQKLSPLVREITGSIEPFFKETYVLEFLNLPENHTEDDLKKQLLARMRHFIAELGKDFLFMGEEYRLQVGTKDFRTDLLFYHRGLQCLVCFELKTTDFEPEYLGKLGFYLEALDRDVKKPHERPSIGVLLCKGKDADVVEYAMSRQLSPALIAEYTLALPDKQLLQQKLQEFYEQWKEREGRE
jgi:predicted nuclease of restriction endonuclease-like (RecB) superfamily